MSVDSEGFAENDGSLVLKQIIHDIHSAHIATYGERAVDVFYLTRADGKKLTPDDVEALRSALADAAREPSKAQAA